MYKRAYHFLATWCGTQCGRELSEWDGPTELQFGTVKSTRGTLNRCFVCTGRRYCGWLAIRLILDGDKVWPSTRNFQLGGFNWLLRERFEPLTRSWTASAALLHQCYYTSSGSGKEKIQGKERGVTTEQWQLSKKTFPMWKLYENCTYGSLCVL